MEPITRTERLLNAYAEGETADLEPITREEKFLNALATGEKDGLPTPITRKEMFLKSAIENQGGGGSEDAKKYHLLNIKRQYYADYDDMYLLIRSDSDELLQDYNSIVNAMVEQQGWDYYVSSSEHNKYITACTAWGSLYSAATGTAYYNRRVLISFAFNTSAGGKLRWQNCIEDYLGNNKTFFLEFFSTDKLIITDKIVYLDI